MAVNNSVTVDEIVLFNVVVKIVRKPTYTQLNTSYIFIIYLTLLT